MFERVESPAQSSGSISLMISAIRHGDPVAPQKIWDRYNTRLRAVARWQLRDVPQSVADEDDVVVDAFWSVFRRLRDGQLSTLVNRHELWRLLATATTHKAIDHSRFIRRQKRFAADQHLACHCAEATAVSDRAISEVDVSDVLSFLLSRLPDDEARRICLLRLDGNTNLKIAEMISRSLPTVERRLKLIREVWNDEVSHD